MTQQPTETPVSPVPQDILEGISFDAPSETPEPNLPTDSPKPDPVITPTDTPAENPVPTEQKVIPPAKYEGEGDIQYNLRTQLFLAGQAKANAETDEEKTILGKEMKRIRENLSQAKVKEVVPTTTPTPTPTPVIQENERKAALDALKQLGVPTSSEIEALIDQRAQAIVQARMNETTVLSKHAEQTSAIEDFYKQRQDIFTDTSKKDMLENQFMSLFKDQLPNMSKQQLVTALDMSANYLFPKGSISKQVDATQNKIDALNISGSQAADTAKVDATMRAKLKAEGWSDADINSFA